MKYLKTLQAEKNPDTYIKTIAVKMFPDEEAYNQRIETYRKRYGDSDLLKSLEELYILYYDIAKDENYERSEEKIEQMYSNMTIQVFDQVFNIYFGGNSQSGGSISNFS